MDILLYTPVVAARLMNEFKLIVIISEPRRSHASYVGMIMGGIEKKRKERHEIYQL